MNYKKIYNDLVVKAFGRQYVSGVHEKHHIVPKSLGGADDSSNIVCFTYKEHFIAHWLLTKFTSGDDKRKMKHALTRMTSKSKFHKGKIVYSWQYALAKKARSEAMIDNNYAVGSNPSEQTRLKMSIARRKRGPASAETREKQRIANLGNQKGKMNKGKKKPEGFAAREKNGRATKIVCLTDGNIYNCIANACETYSISRTGMNNVLSGKWASTKGYSFKYLQR